MISRRGLLSFVLLQSETCFLAILYLLITQGLLVAPVVNPWYLFTLNAVLIPLHLFLTGRPHRYLTLMLASLAVLLSFAWLTTRGTGFFFFSFPPGIGEVINYLTAYALLFFCGIRAITLVRKGAGDIYPHFDLYIFCTFLLLLIAALSRTELPGITLWLITAVLLNILSLYLANFTLSNNSAKGSSFFSWFPVLATLLILPLSLLAGHLFPYLTAPAGRILDYTKPFFAMLEKVLIILLKSIFRVNRNIPAETLTQTSPSIGAQDITPAPWLAALLDPILRIGLYVLLFALSVGLLFLLYSLVRLLFSWLLGTQEGIHSGHSEGNAHWWRSIKPAYLAVVKTIHRYVRLCLPGRLPVDQAYHYLLCWGRRKRCPRFAHETPYEYCHRLGRLFPDCQHDLFTLTSLYTAFCYAPPATPPVISYDLMHFLRKLYFPTWFAFTAFLKGR